MNKKGKNNRSRPLNEKNIPLQNENIQRILNEINNLVKTPYDSNEFAVKINEIVKYLVENISQLENLKKLYENGVLDNSPTSDNKENSEREDDSTKSDNRNASKVERTSITDSSVSNTTDNIDNTKSSENRRQLPPNLLTPKPSPVLIGGVGTGGVKKDIANALIEETLNITEKTTSPTDAIEANGATDTTGTTTGTPVTPSESLTQLTDAITKINILKVQLCRLPLNLCEPEYISVYISPLLSVLTSLGGVSISLATAFNLLSENAILTREKYKIKKYIHVTYEICDQMCDLYEIVGKRISKVIDCTE